MTSIPAFPSLRTPMPSPWLQALVANVQDAIVILDAEGRLIYENPSASRILGIPSDDVLATFGLSRIHPEDRGAVVESFRRTIVSPGATSRATYRFQRADGDWRHLEAVAKNLIDDPEIRGVLITFRDVSERIRAMEAAESASRARDEFLYNIGQELRAPIDAMLACVEGSAGWDELRQHGGHLLRLIEEAVDLAGVRNGVITLQRDVIAVDALLEEVRARVEDLGSRKDVRVAVSLDAGGALVVVDQVRLGKVLLDLVDGLARSSHQGGEVQLASRVHMGRVLVELTSRSGGMTERQIEDAYDRFDRIGGDGAAAGDHRLGLAIAGRLIELSGGSMGVETAPGGAVSVWLQLPIL
jgi:PAS domain S-box-containing protein